MFSRAETVSVLLVGSMLIGCAETPQAEPVIQDRQAEMDGISDECGAPHEWLEVLPGGDIVFQPAADAEIEIVECLLEKLHESGTENLGFFGNDVLPDAIEGQ